MRMYSFSFTSLEKHGGGRRGHRQRISVFLPLRRCSHTFSTASSIPDRPPKTPLQTFQNHPEIQYVSRDRGNGYAQAIRDGFGQIMRKREGHRLDEWKRQVAESGIAELQRFVKGLERDKEAIEAGLTLAYSNGVVEGKVNKLKLIKRMGYGRASFN